MWRILSIFVIIILMLLSMAMVLGFAIGIGWLLTLLFPFSLFEASLLALIASIVVGSSWYYLFGSVLGLGGEIPDEDIPEVFNDDFDQIPHQRFYKTHIEKTWEAWLRHHLANSIYFEFQESPQPIAPMGRKQTQELAIRLADLSVEILKAKSVRAKRLNISAATLKKQMNKIGQRPYDDDILGLAAIAINTEVSYHYEELLRVIHTKLWKHPYDGFEAKGEF
jgi:hypothetical protein